MIKAWAPFLAGLLAAGAAAQQPTDTLEVDVATALRMGLEGRPELREAEAAVGIAAGERRQAGVYPFNPSAQVKLLSVTDRTDYEAILSQEIEWAGQMRLRKAVADRALDAARAREDGARLAAAHEIRVAYYTAWAAERRYQLRVREVELRAGLRDAVAIELREGKVSDLDLNLAQVQAGLARAAERVAWGQRSSAMAELGRAIGLPPDRPVQPVAESGLTRPSVAQLSGQQLATMALERRPDVVALRASLEGARSRARLINRLVLPNLTLAAVAEGVEGEGSLWGVRIGLPLPLLNRSQGTHDAADAEAQRVGAAVAALELAIRSEVERALETWRAASQAVTMLTDEAVDPARRNQELVQIAYTEGKLDLPTTLLLQTQLLDAELSFVEAQLSERRAASELARAVGDLTFDPGG
jgi:cobalt-zinc-cadmium efflux system outer membrane protein